MTNEHDRYKTFDDPAEEPEATEGHEPAESEPPPFADMNADAPLAPTDPEAEQMVPENAGDDTGEARIKALEDELDRARDQALRAVAEAENTRKRLLREREDVRKYAVADFARDLLDFADNFRRALDSLPAEAAESDERIKNVMTGIEAMGSELRRTMEKHHIRKIEPIGEPFDPNYHEAMFEAPGTGQPAGTVIEMIEPGYVLHDRLLRPARVGIAKDDGSNGTPPGHPGGQIDTEA